MNSLWTKGNPLPRDTNRKIRATFFIDYCVPNSQQDIHSAFCTQLTSPRTSPVFTVLLLEPFLKPQMSMNSVFLIFLLVSFYPSHHLVNVYCECPHRALKHFIYLASCTEYLSTKILGRNSSRIIRVRLSRQEKITWLLWKWKGSCYIPSSSFRFSRQNFHRSIKVYVLYTVWKNNTFVTVINLFYKYPNFFFNLIQTDLKSWV